MSVDKPPSLSYLTSGTNPEPFHPIPPQSRHLGAVSIRKTVLPGMAIPMLKIRRPTGRLIFNMGIPIPGKTVFYIETRPCVFHDNTQYTHEYRNPSNVDRLHINKEQYLANAVVLVVRELQLITASLNSISYL